MSDPQQAIIAERRLERSEHSHGTHNVAPGDQPHTRGTGA